MIGESKFRSASTLTVSSVPRTEAGGCRAGSITSAKAKNSPLVHARQAALPTPVAQVPVADQKMQVLAFFFNGRFHGRFCSPVVTGRQKVCLCP